MFLFGSTEDNARLFEDLALTIQGPKIPDIPMEEMTSKMLEIHLTYARIAYESSLKEGSTEEVQNFLLDKYDSIFARLCEISEKFRTIVHQNRHRYVNEIDPKSVKKYRKLAGID